MDYLNFIVQRNNTDITLEVCVGRIIETNSLPKSGAVYTKITGPGIISPPDDTLLFIGNNGMTAEVYSILDKFGTNYMDLLSNKEMVQLQHLILTDVLKIDPL
jgi:hypothetical protein